MEFKKAETNNVIVVRLGNVRKHPNANKLQLADVLGTQVVVGLDAYDGQLVLYWDSNMKVGRDFLHYNNLYSNSELNADPSKKGYFGKTGRVKCQRFRGEFSNGYVSELCCLTKIPGIFENIEQSVSTFPVGTEFTHIGDILIGNKYIVESKKGSGQGGQGGKNRQRKRKPKTKDFHKHWDTKQLCREGYLLCPGELYIEEKIHGTSGRTAHVVIDNYKAWYKPWTWHKPYFTHKYVSGTRNREWSVGCHIWQIRQEIHDHLVGKLFLGEQVYYEIYGDVAQGGWTYGVTPGKYKVMLYRVTYTDADGICTDYDREYVYKRAKQLGLEAPYVIDSGELFQIDIDCLPKTLKNITALAEGNSNIHGGTLMEGIVVWFKGRNGLWTCLKHKSDAFLLKESKQRDKGIGDVEDEL